MIHAYLADSIKIKIICDTERIQNPRALPSAVSEPLSQERLLRLHIIDRGSVDGVVRKHKQEHGAILMHGEPPHLLTHLRIHDIDQFVSWPVALHFECSDVVPQILLEAILGTENELSHS